MHILSCNISLPDYHDNIAFNIPIIDPDPTPQKEIEKSGDIRLLFFRGELLAYIMRSLKAALRDRTLIEKSRDIR
ncbi:MAG: hypothetical protein QNJ38_16420 [Prochloraceae cyanobacterium]|nr:hypothetical protein [Prochloraceae cyanobacterium]